MAKNKNQFSQFKFKYDSALKTMHRKLSTENPDEAFHLGNLIRIINSLSVDVKGSMIKIPFEQRPNWDNDIFFYIDTTNDKAMNILNKFSKPAAEDYKNNLFDKLHQLATTLGEEKNKSCRLGNP